MFCFVASDVCKMPKDAGPCEEYRVVWYFEPVGRHCRRFYYGGCDGNENKFNSSEECHSRCLWSGYSYLGSRPDSHHTFEATNQQTTPALVAHVTPTVSAHVTKTSSSAHTTQDLTMAFLASTASFLDEPPSHHGEGQFYLCCCDFY